MKYITILFALMACSGEHTNIRTFSTDWKVVGTVTIHIGKSDGMYAVSPINTNITYTEVEKGSFTLNSGTIAASEIDDSNLSLGTLEVQTISVNKLKICGGGGTTKCTVAAIRMYTTGHPEAGFYNTTEGYGIPITADGSTIGLDIVGATIVENYIIPANDKKLQNNDFSDLVYSLNVDIGNAEAGDYEMNLVIELVVGI